MNYYFITGSSKGIGKSLVEVLLENENHFVFGFSRTNTLKHPRFKFIPIDFLDSSKLDKFQFPQVDDAKSLTLINNAGLIGDIAPVGDKKNEAIKNTFLVNTIAPAILCNQFIKQFSNILVKKSIINISSGAGRHTVNSWADYCASKSALDMYSQVIFDEQKDSQDPITIISIAPGVIDTSMQIEIRKSGPEKFANHQYFVKLKEDDKLDSPDFTARKIIKILPQLLKDNKCITDIREY